MLRQSLVFCAVILGLGLVVDRPGNTSQAGDFLWRYARQMTPNCHNNNWGPGYQGDYISYGREGYHYGCRGYTYQSVYGRGLSSSWRVQPPKSRVPQNAVPGTLPPEPASSGTAYDNPAQLP